MDNSKAGKVSYHRKQSMYGGRYYFHHFYNSHSSSDKKLLLLHGIRLGGLETWGLVINELQDWSEIIVPELPCSGALNPLNKTAADLTLEQLYEPIIDLVNSYQWRKFDLVGYSYGGFLSLYIAKLMTDQVGHHINLESALLVDAIENLHHAGKGLLKIAALMHYDPEQANAIFSENTYQRQAGRQFALVASRFNTANPLGFANLVKILNDIYEQPLEVLFHLLTTQKKLTLLMTLPLSEEKRKMIASLKQCCSFNVEYIDKADHSVVFSHPHRIAKIINRIRQTGDEMD